MNLKDYWCVFESVIPHRLCDDIIRHGENALPQIGLTGNQEAPEPPKDLGALYKIRNSHISWLDDPWIYREVIPYVNKANVDMGWNFEIRSPEACQFTRYSTTQHYSWHQDSFPKPNSEGLVRKLSVTVSLEDGNAYKGGDLEICVPDKAENRVDFVKKVRKARTKGSVIVFPSFVWHRVTPVTEGTRYSLVVWNNGFPFR